jgi:hypothetical protein
LSVLGLGTQAVDASDSGQAQKKPGSFGHERLP